MFSPYKYMVLICLLITIFSFSGCSSGNKDFDDGHVIARINDFSLTKEEFQKKLIKEMEYNQAYKTTPEAKQEFLQSIIKKELFIQEAKRMGLDRDPRFISAIERYWEATLIKHLMEIKNEDIVQVISISENEILHKYNALKSENPSIPPLKEIEEEIAKELFESKKTAQLDQWTASLYKNAEVKINSKFINE